MLHHQQVTFVVADLFLLEACFTAKLCMARRNQNSSFLCARKLLAHMFCGNGQATPLAAAPLKVKPSAGKRRYVPPKLGKYCYLLLDWTTKYEEVSMRVANSN
uniref:Tick transposon n=1 Tax=Rhipicephalus zambeziensis TaxID=60191 RepID=A0A224YBW9_9ACAR